MEFIDRKINENELDMIYKDFKQIEKKHGINSEKNSKRLNTIILDVNNIIGFASGLTHNKWFFLTDLWIREDYRGKGLGRELLKRMDEKVLNNGMSHIYTWTTGYNNNDLFYEKCGYRKCLVFDEFFDTDNGSHICLIKDL